MSYVDAGYAAALGTLFVYAVSLILRRCRWARAASVLQAGPLPDAPAVPAAAEGSTAPVVPGGRP